MNLTEKQLERITKKANTKKVKDECEPNVCWQLELQKWMVRRAFVAAEKLGYKVVKE